MRKGFTLIELLITIMIIGILVAIATFGIRQAQQSARDGRRKTELENIALALELYRSDCNRYPGSLSFGGSLAGTGSGRCTGTYMSTVPTDPQPGHGYSYLTNAQGTSFNLCASLEQPPASPNVSGCATCTGGCDWRVSRP